MTWFAKCGGDGCTAKPLERTSEKFHEYPLDILPKTSDDADMNTKQKEALDAATCAILLAVGRGATRIVVRSGAGRGGPVEFDSAEEGVPAAAGVVADMEECRVCFYSDSAPIGWMSFAAGNGADAVCDYSDNEWSRATFGDRW